MPHGMPRLSKEELANLAKVELCRIALALLVLEAGGRLKITPYDLGAHPLGKLSAGWNTNGMLEVRYTPHDLGQPIRAVDLLSLAVLVQQAGGRIIFKEADTTKMPNGVLGHVMEGDDIVWVYAQGKERIG